MTVMVAEIYDALRGVGVADDAARRAAEAVADNRSGLRDEIAGLRAETRAEFGKLRQEMRDGDNALRLDIQGLRGELTLLKWMTGLSIAISLGILTKLLFP